jgi:DNA-binding NarL/FixJ family response regulator
MSKGHRIIELLQHTAGRSLRLANISAMVRIMRPLNITATSPLMRRRRLLADLCRLVGESVGAGQLRRSANGTNTTLPPRQDQTLRHLLEGDSEKQVARKLSLSQHTVHVYVKALYRRYGVSSRAELLAKHLSR